MPPPPLPPSALPAGVRPMRPDDAPAIQAALFAAHERGEFEGTSRDQLVEWVDRLRAEPWQGAVAEDAGRLAGWVVPRLDDLGVEPAYRRRGHGRRLVEAGRVMAGHAGLSELRLWVPHRQDAEAFARDVGLRYRSSLWLMRLDDAAAPPPPSFPEDVLVRRLEPGVDEPAYVDLVNEVFLDHPTPFRINVDEVRRVHARPDTDPSLVLLVAWAADGGRLIGFCRISRFRDDDGVLAGDVRLLGVRREARGRGLGRELVRWGVDGLRSRGAERTYISVEGENEGALRVYEREGFRPAVEWPHWSAPAIAPAARATPGEADASDGQRAPAS